MIMFAPINDSPVERSRTVPVILPVVPAFNVDPKIQTQRKMNRILTRREIRFLIRYNFADLLNPCKILLIEPILTHELKHEVIDLTMTTGSLNIYDFSFHDPTQKAPLRINQWGSKLRLPLLKSVYLSSIIFFVDENCPVFNR